MSLFLIILLVIMILPIKFTVENVLVLVNFILPSNIKRKYQNSSFYLNIIKDKKSLLTSKKLSDNFKLKLINKKLLKRLSTEDILNIISNLKKDKSMFNILTNINIFKNTHTTSEKIDFKNPMYYEKLYNFINENDKINYLTHIKNDEFVAFYQPKVDINSGKLVGAEALIRWRTRDNKLIAPGDFIPLSEKTGLVTDLDMIVFEKVLAFLRSSLDAGVECVPISVNFSRLHFSNEKFLPTLLQKMEKYQVPAHLIELELTESAIFDNFSIIYDFTEKVREYGVAVAMDDFGSGYSSLNMLKDLSIDTLKVDRAFLEEAADNEKRNIIFVSVVEMARKLNISLVVEGVETGENVSLMRECGCNIAQGYYFARPMEESKFAELFREGKLC